MAAEFKDTLLTAPSLIWMAEYNNECMDIIQTKYLGMSDAVMDKIKAFILKHNWTQEFDDHQLVALNLNDWEGTISEFIIG